jgi:hypothetical protein
MSKHLRALEVEALAYSNLTGAIDAQSPTVQAASGPAARPLRRARVLVLWNAIASLLSGRGVPGSQTSRTIPE